MRTIRKYYFYYALTYLCTNNCLNCPISESQKRKISFLKTDIIKEDLEKILSKDNYGKFIIELSGGEPLLHPEIKNILSLLINRYKSYVLLLTNGQLLHKILPILEKSDFRKDLYVATAIYHFNPTIHDYITQRKGSFKRKIKNLKKLLELDYQIEIKLLVMKNNYKELPNIVHSLINIFEQHLDKINFSIHGIDLVGNAKKYARIISISFSEAVPFIEKAVDILSDLGLNFYLSHIPLCLIDPYYWRFFEYISPQLSYTAARHPDGSVIGSLTNSQSKIIISKKCQECSLRNSCSYWPSYVSLYTDKEFLPIKIREVEKND